MDVRRQSLGLRQGATVLAHAIADTHDRKDSFTGPARAVADTARALTAFRDVRAVVSDAVQKRLCSVEALRAELAQGPPKGSGLLRRALAEVGDGIRSVPEGDLRLLLKRARLPTPMFNARLYEGDTLIAIVDCWWPEAGVAGEVDSREYHYSADDWQRTMRRHDQLVARGVLLLHFTPQRIRTDPDGIVLEILSALAAGCGRPSLTIKALPPIEAAGRRPGRGTSRSVTRVAAAYPDRAAFPPPASGGTGAGAGGTGADLRTRPSRLRSSSVHAVVVSRYSPAASGRNAAKTAVR